VDDDASTSKVSDAVHLCLLHSNRYCRRRILHRDLRTNTEDAGLREILERILAGVIVFEPLTRLLLCNTDLKSTVTRVVVAPERRNRPFIVPRS